MRADRQVASAGTRRGRSGAMNRPARVVHYLNQFFGGIGGEEHAYEPLRVSEGPVGAARALQAVLGAEGTVVATIVAGDNAFTEEPESCKAGLRDALDRYRPDVVIAGPAFDAGRYGLACAEVCRVAQVQGIHAVTAMHPENAGILTYRRELLAVPTGSDSSEMKQALTRMVDLAMKLFEGKELGPAAVEGYIPRGVRRPVTHEEPGYVRAIRMLCARLRSQPHASEMLLTSYDTVP